MLNSKRVSLRGLAYALTVCVVAISVNASGASAAEKIRVKLTTRAPCAEGPSCENASVVDTAEETLVGRLSLLAGSSSTGTWFNVRAQCGSAGSAIIFKFASPGLTGEIPTDGTTSAVPTTLGTDKPLEIEYSIRLPQLRTSKEIRTCTLTAEYEDVRLRTQIANAVRGAVEDVCATDTGGPDAVEIDLAVSATVQALRVYNNSSALLIVAVQDEDMVVTDPAATDSAGGSTGATGDDGGGTGRDGDDDDSIGPGGPSTAAGSAESATDNPANAEGEAQVAGLRSDGGCRVGAEAADWNSSVAALLSLLLGVALTRLLRGRARRSTDYTLR